MFNEIRLRISQEMLDIIQFNNCYYLSAFKDAEDKDI
jgi:hypothetical protein